MNRSKYILLIIVILIIKIKVKSLIINKVNKIIENYPYL